MIFIYQQKYKRKIIFNSENENFPKKENKNKINNMLKIKVEKDDNNDNYNLNDIKISVKIEQNCISIISVCKNKKKIK